MTMSETGLLLVILCMMSPPVTSAHHEVLQTGIASWYGPGFNGRLTATGERYDEDLLSAASRTIPLGTDILVTNLQNDKSIIVRINDRGPYIKNRILDLSKAAASELDFITRGTTKIRIEEYDNEE